MKMTVSFNVADIKEVGDAICEHLKMLRQDPPADQAELQRMMNASAMRLARSLEYLTGLVNQIMEFENEPSQRPN